MEIGETPKKQYKAYTHVRIRPPLAGASSTRAALASLAQAGVQHVERHLVAFLRARDRDEALGLVACGLINLDYAS